MNNPVKALENHGQAVWLDFLARGFVAKGELKKLIDTDGVKGVTSNPSIFEKAIGSSAEYDGAIGSALKKGDRPVADLFEHLAVEDIQRAADVLRPVYDRLKGEDGFVSLEVSPYLAMDSEGTIAEAKRLWKDVRRKNLMIKVPATPEGLPAIEHLTGEGISINITLLFSQKVYVQVAEAYLAGLEKYVAGGGDPSHVASVASFFVSRIDSAVDKQLDEKIARANDPSEKERLAALKGKVAIANAKLAYQEYKRLFSGARWEKLAAKGAKPQRLLWASTGTKNKDYSDVLYVEELIGPNTVNTVPPATLDAFRDHGKLRDSLEENVEGARRVLAELEKSGISLDAITAELVKDGVKLFADAADKLYGAVAHKRATVLGDRHRRPEARARRGDRKGGRKAHRGVARGGQNPAAMAKGQIGLDRRRRAQMAGVAEQRGQGRRRRLRRLCAAGEEVRISPTPSCSAWADRASGPKCWRKPFRRNPASPNCTCWIPPIPRRCARWKRRSISSKTLFIVSSKSGGTTEPNVMKDYFFARVVETIGVEKAGHRFIAVTDPGSSLEKTATKQGFARIFHGDPAIGGRYSVLSPFGLVPAATAGIDVRALIRHALAMMRSCGPDVPPHENPGVQLGLAMGLAGLEGRDKVTITSSREDFGFRRLGRTTDRRIHRQGRQGPDSDRRRSVGRSGAVWQRPVLHRSAYRKRGRRRRTRRSLPHWRQVGHPVVRIVMKSIEHIGQEFFRFEMATAVAGAVLGINPFNQPDVEAAKIKTRELTAAFEKSGALPAEAPVMSTVEADLYTDEKNAADLRKAGADGDLGSWLKAHLSRAHADDYVALLAYIERNAAHIGALQDMRLAVRDNRHVATCAEFGPRFLHSTGQAYKGGPDNGVFLQITSDDARDLPVPGQKASFGVIKAAQARGDFDVLTERGRRALRVHLKGDLEAGLKALDTAIRYALN